MRRGLPEKPNRIFRDRPFRVLTEIVFGTNKKLYKMKLQQPQ